MNIIWSISTIEDVKFLKRFKVNFTGKITLIHTNFITYIYSIFTSGYKNHLPRYNKKNIKDIDVEKNFNVLSGRLNKSEAVAAYSSTYSLLEEMDFSENSLFVIPSGRQIHQWALRDFAYNNNIKKLFINYGNFPGHTIFDSMGTDKLSSLYQNIGLLDIIQPIDYKDEEIDAIFKHFQALKREQKSIPQATGSKFTSLLKVTLFKLDYLLQLLFSVYSDRRTIKKTNIALESTPTKTKFYKIKDLNVPYEKCIFFPLQVSTDQQVLLNYKGGNIESAIEEVINIAREAGKIIILKEHPGEHFKAAIHSKVTDICQKNGVKFFWVDNHVSEVIEIVKHVVTVNSTVGLEALINDNNVTFIGDSLYKNMNRQHIAKYLNDYLIRVDYQLSSEIDKNHIKNILLRAN